MSFIVLTDEQVIAKARDDYQEEGAIEIDDNATTSRTPDGGGSGCYVQAWVWVDFEVEENPDDIKLGEELRTILQGGAA